MCGRVVQEIPKAELQKQFAVAAIDSIDEVYFRYNIGPTSRLVMVLNEDGEKTAKYMRWGLVPSWVKNLNDFNATTFNARSETVESSKVYAASFKRRRCIVPVSGYYEWKKLPDKTKQPYYFKPRHGSVLALAGLWDRTTLNDGTLLESCTVLTCEPNNVTAEYHNRMPVILMATEWDNWLEPSTPPEHLRALMQPIHEDFLKIIKVSTAVGNVRNDSPDNIIELEDDETLF